jgi:pimeloyl-ACP methyl ester carboxylesterase
METARIGDIDICYELLGDGPPLVMIMGYSANIDWWDPELVEDLANSFRLLLFDNRGAGRTSAGAKRFSIPQFARDIAGLMEVLGIERAHVIGASMGGMIAQQIALDYPHMVDGLVLCCTAPGGIHTKLPSFRVIVKLAVLSRDPEKIAHRVVDVLFPETYLYEHPETRDRLIEVIGGAPITPRNAMRQAMAVARFSMYGRIPSIRSSTLVLCGGKDILAPPKNSRTLAGRIPGATLYEFEGAGHGFTTQCNREVARLVTDFLIQL